MLPEARTQPGAATTQAAAMTRNKELFTSELVQSPTLLFKVGTSQNLVDRHTPNCRAGLTKDSRGAADGAAGRTGALGSAFTVHHCLAADLCLPWLTPSSCSPPSHLDPQPLLSHGERELDGD